MTRLLNTIEHRKCKRSKIVVDKIRKQSDYIDLVEKTILMRHKYGDGELKYGYDSVRYSMR